MIGNQISNSIKAIALNSLELYQSKYTYYRPDQRIYINNRPIMLCIVLGIINLEAKVSTKDLKDKLYSVKIIDFKGDMLEMLTYVNVM